MAPRAPPASCAGQARAYRRRGWLLRASAGSGSNRTAASNTAGRVPFAEPLASEHTLGFRRQIRESGPSSTEEAALAGVRDSNSEPKMNEVFRKRSRALGDFTHPLPVPTRPGLRASTKLRRPP